MAFETTRALSREVKAMPAGARKIWTAAFTAALTEKPEDMAADLALAAVQKHFAQENGQWIAKKNDPNDPDGLGDPESDPSDPTSPDYDPALDPESDEYDPEAAKAAEEEAAAEEADPELEEDPEIDPEADPEADPEGDLEGGEDTPIEEEPDPAALAAGEAETAEEAHVVARARAKLLAKRKATMAAAETGTGDSSIEVTETFAFDAKGFRLTNDGYLVATPRIARIGIQLYKGHEVGRPDMDVVRVFRSEDEVFDTRAMTTLAHRPITLEHPDRPVDASNWRELAIGHSTGEIARDGDFIRVPLVLMDAHAIAAAQSGKSQLSVGYGAKLMWGAGQAPDGQLYDAMQSEIRANHIALVSAARGGDKLNIGDSRRKVKGNHDSQKQRRRAMTDINIDGVTIELDDKDGQILDRHLSGLSKKFKDQGVDIEALKAQIAQLQAQLAQALKAGDSKDGEIVELKKQVEDGKITPAKRDKEIKDFMAIVDRAMTFFGDTKYEWEGKSVEQIRRDVVTARHGEQKAKAMNDGMIEGAFLSLTETEQQDGITRLTQSFSRPGANNYSDAAAKAYDKRNEDLSNRFRKNKKPFQPNA